MKLYELPPGNGQEIYIDAEDLDIEPSWINRELHAIFMPNILPNLSNPVYETYQEMFQRLYELGYKIITDSREVNDDTFFFSPCLDKHINSTKEEYASKKRKKVMSLLNKEGIYEPFTVAFPPNYFPLLLPELPFVLKNEDSQGGMEKFLIKTPEQLEILKRFYSEATLYDKEKRIAQLKKEWSFISDLEIYEDGKSNKGICANLVDYKEEFHKNMRIQEYVKTPTQYNTSLRVLTSSSGDILAASLKYSLNQAKEEEKFYGLFDRYLSNPTSPYYLGSESIVSNTVAGGASILLGKDSYTPLEQDILAAHGIDATNAIVPQGVSQAAISVATKCSHEIGAICGLDFIYDVSDKAWRYLEEHEFPMLYSYAEKYNLPYDANSREIYTNEKLLDMQARLQALALTMAKKQSMLRLS